MKSNYLFTNSSGDTSDCVLSWNDNNASWQPQQENNIKFTDTPKKYQLFLLKLLGIQYINTQKNHLTEEEIINNRRRVILDDILKKKYWLW
jgi:hypothetical protein